MAKTTRTKKEPAKVIPLDSEAIGKAVEAQSNNGIVASEQPPANTQEKPVEEQPKPDPVPANTTGQQLAQPVVTQEIVTARFKAELTKFQYQDTLQKFIDLPITEDNLAIVQKEMANMRGFIRKMEAIKTVGKKPALDRCRMWDSAYNDLSNALEEELARKQKKINEIAQQQQRVLEIARKEQERKEYIKTAIDNFILEQSQKIAGCKTDSELVNIQKALGSHKSNTSRYQEFLPELIERCNKLNPLINTQKEAIRELRDLEEKKKEAEAKGDDATLIEIEDKKEQLTATVEEQKVLVQEEAISQATRPDETTTGVQIYNTIKARRSKWKIELLEDKKSIQKAFDAGLLDFEINKEKGEVLINTLKDAGQLKDVKEFISNGCKIYLEELF